MLVVAAHLRFLASNLCSPVRAPGHENRSAARMSTNVMLAVLYVELGVFILGIAGPLVLKLIDDVRQSREHVTDPDQRNLVVSRLST